MSTPATSYRLFYPDSNTVTGLALFAPDGAALTPQTLADGSGDPSGWKSKVITFAANAEPLFVTPTFQTPASPVAVYLCRDDAGTFKKVLDETVFNDATPGRPTPAGNASQYLLYTATDLGGGVKTYAVKTPETVTPIIRKKAKDPVTGAPRYGNDILLRWSGLVPSAIEVECDVEDITDPSGYFPVAVSNVTTYAESSVGLSLVQSQAEIIPQDGLSHMLKFRLRYNVNGDPGAWVETPQQVATYEMPPPNAPVSLTATLLRDRVDTVPDVVKLEWQRAASNPGTGLVIYAYDYLDARHTVYTSNGSETEARIENVSRFIVQDAGPAVARAYRFAIVSTNISSKSDEVLSGSLNITSKVKAVEAPTPDEVAGTARELTYATFKAEVYSDVLTALGTLPAEGQSIVNSTLDRLILKLKDVVAKGGSIILDDFGVFAAKWTKDRLARNPATGEPVLVPAYRSQSFTPSLGFKLGTKTGTLLTDAQAKAL